MSYKPSNYWQRLSKTCDEFLNKYGYENFKRTIGILYNDYYFNYGNGTIDDDYEEKVKVIWRRMYELYPSAFLDRFSEPEEGNPFRVQYRGRLVSIDLAASISEYCLLRDKIDFSKSVSTIHEIGAGYGRLAHVITMCHPNLTYRIYDIEPSLSLSTHYLSYILPSIRFEFNTPDKLCKDCDILIAMDCLHEMTKEQVHKYFKYAHKHAKFFYYTCWKSTIVKDDNIKWDMTDYPVRRSWKELFLGQHRMRTQFFEALYKI